MPAPVSNHGTEDSSSPQLSPEFLSCSTEDGLDRIRTRLLDLTNRNKLLNFRHSLASSLRIVDVQADHVYTALLDGQKLPFLAVPEPDEEAESDLGEGRRENPSAEDYARQIGWNSSYDLPLEGGQTGCLPVLHYLEALDTRTRKIGSAARTVIEESGTNMLNLVFGFLEWYESDDSQQAHQAPLIVLPVTMERGGSRNKGFECTLEYSGEDLSSNLSLVEKVRQDFGIDVPILDEDDTPEPYFSRFGPILYQKKRWRIRRQITLSLLSFGKFLMYRDLDPKTWPEAESISEHALVKELFEGKKSETIAHAEEFQIDAPELKAELPPLILDADSSQHSALIHALRGQNLVIEGPPGTGKSQTITNLIAAALANGKTVLFVSEKLAALEVVRRRLDEAGLGLFCLELHSHKTKKDALLNDLTLRLKAQYSFREPGDLDGYLAVAEEKKQLLTQYASLINKHIEPFHATAFEILWARDRCYQELPLKRELAGHVPVVGNQRT